MSVCYFEDKMIVPQEEDLKIILGSIYPLFREIYSYMEERVINFSMTEDSDCVADIIKMIEIKLNN